MCCQTNSQHLPARPGWKCRDCDRDWPCAVAVKRLREEYADDRTALSIYLAAQYLAALDDLGDSAVSWKRFFTWLS